MNDYLRRLMEMMDQLGQPSPVPSPQAQMGPPAPQGQMAPGMTHPGNIDLAHRPIVYNPDGSYSTVRSMGANINGKETLIPTVSDQGFIMSPDEAIATAQRTGHNLGTFRDPRSSEIYAQNLHEDQAGQYEQMMRRGDPTVGPPRPTQAAVQIGAPQVQPSIGIGRARIEPTEMTVPGLNLTNQGSEQRPAVQPAPMGRRGAEVGQESHPVDVEVGAPQMEMVKHPDGRITMTIPHEIVKHIMKTKPKKKAQ